MLQELLKSYPGVVEYQLIADKKGALVRFDSPNDAKLALAGKDTYLYERVM